MKNLSYLLLFVIAFIACDNVEKEAEQAAATVEKIVQTATETNEAKIEYPFRPEKETFELNEEFHVMALSGLRMRATPELKGKTILTIPYDGIVEQVDKADYGILEVEEMKGFKVKGNWMKVRHEGKEGYVFDGFLTQFPLPEILENNEYDYYKYSSSFDFYFRTKIGNMSERYDSERYEDCEITDESDCVCAYTQDFGTITYSETGCSETGMEYNIKIKDISFTEAYFIIKAMDLNRVNGADSNEEFFETTTYDAMEKTINIGVDGAGCYTTIKEASNNTIEIETYCGC